jgi:hypothetical protein
MSLARAIYLRPEDLVGRTWAGYLRESTRAQADRYGPELQGAEQRQFAERHGLVPTEREYVDLVSGKDTLRRTDFARMLADADASTTASPHDRIRISDPHAIQGRDEWSAATERLA